MKTLIVFYSYGGNTRSIAHMMQREIGGDLAERETVDSYIGSFDDVVDQAKQEIDNDMMRAIKPLHVNIATYDRIVLGSPVWWYTFAPAVKTFLHINDLYGKIVLPFATNAGWLGHTFKDYEKNCRGAYVKKGLNVRFSDTTLSTSAEEIKKWIKSQVE